MDSLQEKRQTQKLAKQIRDFYIRWMVHTATGRPRADHLGHLGYRSKFYRVPDISFTHNSNYGSNVSPIFQKNTKKSFVLKEYVKNKRPLPGNRDTVVRACIHTHTQNFK